MTRRRMMLMAAASVAVAATREDILDVLMKLAAALAANDAYEFFRHIDKSLPGRDKLAGYIDAITAEADITSSVELVSVNGEAADADWYLELKGRGPGSPVERRRQVLKVRIAGDKAAALDPLDFFAPMRIPR